MTAKTQLSRVYILSCCVGSHDGRCAISSLLICCCQRVTTFCPLRNICHVLQSTNACQLQGATDDDESSPLRLLGRVLYPAIKSQLGCGHLAVRQEHLSLLRALVLAFPTRFPELLVLTSADPETDFFLNVAHLQLHRRGRRVKLHVLCQAVS